MLLDLCVFQRACFNEVCTTALMRCFTIGSCYFWQNWIWLCKSPVHQKPNAKLWPKSWEECCVVPKLGGALCGPKAGRSIVWSQSWEERCVVPKLGGALCGPKAGRSVVWSQAGRSIVWSQSWEEHCVVPKLGGALCGPKAGRSLGTRLFWS